MRISGAIPQSSYTPSWCSQTQFYLLSPRIFLDVLRSTLPDTSYRSSENLPLSGNHEKSAVVALQQILLNTVTHLFSHLTTAGFFPNTTHSNRQQPESQSDYINMDWGAPCPRPEANCASHTQHGSFARVWITPEENSVDIRHLGGKGVQFINTCQGKVWVSSGSVRSNRCDVTWLSTLAGVRIYWVVSLPGKGRRDKAQRTKRQEKKKTLRGTEGN